MSYVCFTKLSYTYTTQALWPDTCLYGRAMILSSNLCEIFLVLLLDNFWSRTLFNDTQTEHFPHCNIYVYVIFKEKVYSRMNFYLMFSESSKNSMEHNSSNKNLKKRSRLVFTVSLYLFTYKYIILINVYHNELNYNKDIMIILWTQYVIYYLIFTSKSTYNTEAVQIHKSIFAWVWLQINKYE